MATQNNQGFIQRATSAIFGNSQPPGSNSSPQVTLPNGEQVQSKPVIENTAAEALVSPMDGFKDIWSNTPIDPKAPAPFDPKQIYASADHTKMLTAARKLDFTKNVPPEQLAKIAAGGAEAVEAFKLIINTVTQDAYAASLFGASRMAQAGFDQYDAGLGTQLPQRIKALNVSEGLRNDNPALAHPSAAPIIQAIEQQMVAKYPNATAQEIRQHANNYLNGFIGLVQAPATKKAAETVANQDEDWSGFVPGGF